MYVEVEDRDETRIEDEVSESCSLPVCDAEITLAARKLQVDLYMTVSMYHDWQ